MSHKMSSNDKNMGKIETESKNAATYSAACSYMINNAASYSNAYPRLIQTPTRVLFKRLAIRVLFKRLPASYSDA